MEGSLHIELSRDVGASLLDGLEYLTGFPYGCVEQTMSAVLPNAVIARAFRDLGVVRPGLTESLEPKVEDGLARLYALQHGDGGWGWWFDDRSGDYQTAWVLLGLGLTRDAGHPVEDQVLDRGAAWLHENLADMDPRTQAFSLYSLAVLGEGRIEWVDILFDRIDSLDPFSQAALAMALHASGDEERARQILDLLAAALERVDGRLYLRVLWEDGESQPEDDGLRCASHRLGVAGVHADRQSAS